MKVSEIKKESIRSRNTPIGRWSSIGPYYAMFPQEFAYDVIKKYSNKGEAVLDPFAGRGTSLYMAGLLGRKSDGIEINPVGWLFSHVKLNPVKSKNLILKRLKEIVSISDKYKEEAYHMPAFFKYCYCLKVLTFLISARANLKWQTRKVDSTLMAFVLLYLHNKIGQGLSNQMQLTKSMGMNYSINWWRKNNLVSPPQIEPYDFLESRINWRYEKGIFDITECSIIYGDSTKKLNRIIKKSKENKTKYKLLLTSPPYYSITDYYADQWLRLWMLGGDAQPKSLGDKHKRRFNSMEDYYHLLDTVFYKASKVMDRKSVIYVRTDARQFTLKTTKEILKKNFPDHKFKKRSRPVNKKTQTHIYNNSTPKPGEVDLILSRK